MITLNDNDFIKLTNFIINNFGINLKKKKILIEGRLTNYILTEGFEDFSQYVNHITTTKNHTDIEKMLNKLTTNHTFFMREQKHFSFFQETILPYFEQKNKNNSISLWSAGCSSGEEPYTLSIILKEYFKNKTPQWDTRLLATDISQKALMQASTGLYDQDKISSLPKDWIHKYFSKQNELFKVTKELRSNVIFKTFNLMDTINFKSKFDVIFCRNVMIYFDKPTKAALVSRFYDALNPGGYLLIGHSETIERDESKFEYIMPATYRKSV